MNRDFSGESGRVSEKNQEFMQAISHLLQRWHSHATAQTATPPKYLTIVERMTLCRPYESRARCAPNPRATPTHEFPSSHQRSSQQDSISGSACPVQCCFKPAGCQQRSDRQARCPQGSALNCHRAGGKFPRSRGFTAGGIPLFLVKDAAVPWATTPLVLKKRQVLSPSLQDIRTQR